MWPNFVGKIDKNIIRRVNFINLITLGSYIAKLKSQGISLQITQTLGDDYVISSYFNKTISHINIIQPSLIDNDQIDIRMKG